MMNIIGCSYIAWMISKQSHAGYVQTFTCKACNTAKNELFCEDSARCQNVAMTFVSILYSRVAKWRACAVRENNGTELNQLTFFMQCRNQASTCSTAH